MALVRPTSPYRKPGEFGPKLEKESIAEEEYGENAPQAKEDIIVNSDPQYNHRIVAREPKLKSNPEHRGRKSEKLLIAKEETKETVANGDGHLKRALPKYANRRMPFDQVRGNSVPRYGTSCLRNKESEESGLKTLRN